MPLLSQGEPERTLSAHLPVPAWPHPVSRTSECQLLIPWTPWHCEFFGNLRDMVWPKAEFDLELTSRPGTFWPDVFVNRRLPFAPIRQSALAHILVILSLWGITEKILLRQPLATRSPFRNAKITYYPVSEYLPEIDTGNTPAAHRLEGQSERAKQPIISIPKVPDNSRQTIVTPPQIKLGQDVALPNIVAWNRPAPEIPVDAVRGAKLAVPPDLSLAVPPPVNVQSEGKSPKLADMMPTAIEPPPDARRMRLPEAKLPGAEAVAPVPEIPRKDIRTPALPSAAVIPPPPGVKTKLGTVDLNQMTSLAAPPRLVPQQQIPVTEQASVPVRVPSRKVRDKGVQHVDGGTVAPAPGALGTSTENEVGRIIALSMHPALPEKPVELPRGNRRGVFSATPDGNPGAPGMPEIKGAPGGSGTGAEKRGRNTNTTAPEGIYVGRGSSSPVADSTAPAMQDPASTKSPQQNALLAALRPRSMADLARETVPHTRPDPPKLQEERRVFGAKRSYAMVINMPNLTSAGGGSWIMRFAELHESADKSDLSAPEVDRKVDPAYPQDLIRERIEGTVMLYAVIRADGSVSEVRVLHSVDQRLDENARVALTKWHFRPGTKHGTAVDIEAVVQIPFSSGWPSF